MQRLFPSVTVYGVLYGERPHTALYPVPDEIELRPLPDLAGGGLVGKLRKAPAVARTLAQIRDAIGRADAIHLRVPDNVAVMALFAGGLARKRFVWAKYAGAWDGWPEEPLSYRLSREALRDGRLGCPVTVNPVGTLPPHCHAFKNPSFSEAELAASVARNRSKRLSSPVTLSIVGFLNPGKGVHHAVDLAHVLTTRGIDTRLHVVGEGPMRGALEEQVHAAALGSRVQFHGVLDPEGFSPLLDASHFVVRTTTTTEGWPKVLSEGMAHRCVPLAFDRGAIGTFLAEAGSGVAVPPQRVDSLADAAVAYIADPDRWQREAEAAASFARGFTYEAYIVRLKQVLENAWEVRFEDHAAAAAAYKPYQRESAV